ncbi:hypothetical protein BD311DRAFT_459488 [Dichomitus squalens]|uniref:Uncharacterized protein n=1 Tax=Dichomitus squalens TaxID=114155 RepID=A0A4Q9MIW9_9APHY|nr:hypothetical protein BD311DRAFT_459488 [Dichomitus squalens]
MRKRRKAAEDSVRPRPRSYNYANIFSDNIDAATANANDEWSEATAENLEHEPHALPGQIKRELSWDPSQFTREKTPSPVPVAHHSIRVTQDSYPGIATSLSSYPPLVPMLAQDRGSWADANSRVGITRSSTNPFRNRLLASASWESTHAGPNGGSWGEGHL